MSTSNLQQQTFDRLKLLLRGFNIKENYRPAWLVNPETGARLELDFYFPDIKIAIEVQGIQHKEFTPYFHGDQDGFEKQLLRDSVKKAICQKKKIILYEVFNEGDIENFIDAVAEFNIDLAKELHKKNTALYSLGFLAARLHILKRKHKNNKIGIDSLIKRILHIAEKYNVPIESIRPDFTITRIQMSYWNKPVVMLDHCENWQQGKILKHGALIRVKDGIATVVRHRQDRKQIEQYFNIETGEEINPNGIQWFLDISSLPDRYIHGQA